MKIQAYAKINIGLRILQRRSDGFHDIETVFFRIDQSDLLEVEATASEIQLSVSSPDIPSDQTNLCWRAAAMLREKLGTRKGVSIRLTKNIPSGGGLGGGSSDAAAVLRALPILWNIDISPELLNETALCLGSDVPFFLQDSPAYARGRGEILTPLEVKNPYWIVTVTPPVHVATGWAYQSLAEWRRKKKSRTENDYHLGSILKKRNSDLIDLFVNDFEKIVFHAFPAIKKLKEELLVLGAAGSLMSGSGASVYGFFKEEKSAIQAKEKLSRQGIVSFTAPGFQPQ